MTLSEPPITSISMADIRSLEHPTLKVPYENLNKRFRAAQKTIEREMAQVMTSIDALDKALATAAPTPAPDAKPGEAPNPSPPAPGQSVLLEAVVSRLDAFEARSREAVEAEVEAAADCKRRLDHLKGGCAGGQDVSPRSLAVWRKTRLDRMLVEHFLRSGFYNSAIRLARAAGITGLTNIGLFLVAKEVEEALAARDTAKCLAWCHDNRSRMRKMRSTLEFNIRLQEYVELVKSGRKMDAVKHARKHLAPTASSDPESMATVQRAMALLAFTPDNQQQQRPPQSMHPAYREFFSEHRWQRLIEEFRSENFRLFQLSSQSVFTVALQAGLSSLKTQRCASSSSSSSRKRSASAVDTVEDEEDEEDEEDMLPTRAHLGSVGGGGAHAHVEGQGDRNSECPVCQDPLHQLAQHLPYAHCSRSRLICYISGRPLNEHNQALMLPNGFVYG